MLLGSGSIAFGGWEQCFGGLEAMLLGSGSIALGVWKQCFWRLGAMLLESGSNASDLTEHSSGGYRALFHRAKEHCSVGYGKVLRMVQRIVLKTA